MSPATVTPTDVPPTWTPLDRYQNCEKVELETSTDEFTTVMSSIYKTLSANRCIVKHVCRLQNALLWHNYQSMKKTLQMAHGTEIIDQRQLFHGTDTLDVVNNICINNFDFRVSGKNATVYGKGAYFARDAKYSHSYTTGRRRYMFLARVLVGKYTLGDSSYTRPPPRKGHVLYDSCVNDEKNPSIFVIFERNQCYPEYLVEYKDGAVDEPSSVKIQPVRARAPPVASSKVQIISQTSSVQPIQAAPSPTKTLAAASLGTTATSNTVSSSSSSKNQRQVFPWMGYTNASSAHTQSSVEGGAVDKSRTSMRQDFSKAELALLKRSCAQSPYFPTKDTPAFRKSILSQKTSTNEGLSSKNEHPQKEISSDSTMYTSTSTSTSASQKTSSNSGLSSRNNQNKTDNPRSSIKDTCAYSQSNAGLSSRNNQNKTEKPRSSIKDTCAYGQSNAGLSSHQIHDSDRMTKDLSADGQSSVSPKTNARLNSLNNQSQVYYKVRSTRGTATYVRAGALVDADDMTANSATYRRFHPTQQSDIPARQSSQMKGKECIIL